MQARNQFLTDMSSIGDALLAVSGALRINYAIFGNVEPALHAHVFPRMPDEPAAIRSAQPWALDWQGAPSFSATEHAAFQRRLAQQLKQARR
jgi:diadenosine tetraphosphate (Ap4A) HIT family hydrolase